MWFILIAIISFIFKRRSIKRSRENTRNNTNTPNNKKLHYMIIYFIISDIIQYSLCLSIQYQVLKYIIFYTIFLNTPTFSLLSFPKFNITNKLYLKYWIINGIRDTLLFVKFIVFTTIFNLVKTVTNLIGIFIKVALEFRKNLKGIRRVTITERLSTPQKLDFGHSKNAHYSTNTSKLENIENLNQMQAQLKNNLDTQNHIKAMQKVTQNTIIDKEISSKQEELEQIRYEIRMRKFKLLELAAKLEEY